MGILKDIAMATVFGDTETAKTEQKEKATITDTIKDIVIDCITAPDKEKHFKTGDCFEPMNPSANKHGYVYRSKFNGKVI